MVGAIPRNSHDCAGMWHILSVLGVVSDRLRVLFVSRSTQDVCWFLRSTCTYGHFFKKLNFLEISRKLIPGHLGTVQTIRGECYGVPGFPGVS